MAYSTGLFIVDTISLCLGMKPLAAKKRMANEVRLKALLDESSVWNRQDGIYNNNYGRKHSEDTKQKIRDKALGRPSSRLGKTHTDESKDKMRQKAIGRPSSRKGVEPWNKGKNMPRVYVECENCKQTFTKQTHARWHGVNCRHVV